MLHDTVDTMHPVFLFAGFFFFAVSYNLLGPLATNIMQTTGLSLSGSGTLVSFQQIGSLISMAVSLLVMKRLKQGSVMKIGYLFLIVALVSIALSSTTTALFIFYLILGLGSFVDSASNATLASEYEKRRSTFLFSTSATASAPLQPAISFCRSKAFHGDGLRIGRSGHGAHSHNGIRSSANTQKQSKKKRDGNRRRMWSAPLPSFRKTEPSSSILWSSCSTWEAM